MTGLSLRSQDIAKVVIRQNGNSRDQEKYLRALDQKTKRKSDAENEFISSLVNGWIWLDITLEHKEGHFIDNKGSKLSWENWAIGEPNNNDGNEGWFVC